MALTLGGCSMPRFMSRTPVHIDAPSSYCMLDEKDPTDKKVISYISDKLDDSGDTKFVVSIPCADQKSLRAKNINKLKSFIVTATPNE